MAMSVNSFWLALAGEAVHGLGSGTVSVAMRAIVSKAFLEKELTFALVRDKGKRALESGVRIRFLPDSARLGVRD